MVQTNVWAKRVRGYYDTENYIQADEYLHTVETSEFFWWILERVGRN